MRKPSMKMLYALAGEHIRDEAIKNRLGEMDTKAITKIIFDYLQYVWSQQSDAMHYLEVEKAQDEDDCIIENCDLKDKRCGKLRICLWCKSNLNQSQKKIN